MTTARRRWMGRGLVLVVVASAVAAFVPVEVRGDKGTPAQVAACRAKLNRLGYAVWNGAAAHETFREDELNAHLDRLLDENPQVRNAQGLTVAVDDLHLDLVPGQARLYVRGRLMKLPFVLEYRIAGGDRAPRCCRTVWLGHVPLPPPLKWIAERHLKRLTRGLRAESTVFEHAHRLSIEENGARVEVAASAALSEGPK